MSNEPFKPELPPFRADGYLPKGVHLCSLAEATFRFGSGSAHRRRLIRRLRTWVGLAREVHATRLLIDGSFVTTKESPKDVDAVLLVSPDFLDQVDQNIEAAVQLQMMMELRSPAELFSAESEADLQLWIEFFSQTRELDKREKGLVEIRL